jgi:hypothetical protein
VTAQRRPPPHPPPAEAPEGDVGAMIEAGVGAGAMFAAIAEARVTVRRPYQLEAAAIAGRDTAAQDGGEARFTWLAARLGGCRRWALPDVAVDSCSHVEVGAVRASGAMIVNHRDLTRLWLAAGVHGNVRYPLHSRVFGILQLGISVPFVRDRFLFAPNSAIHETPVLTGWLVAGIGLRFP